MPGVLTVDGPQNQRFISRNVTQPRRPPKRIAADLALSPVRQISRRGGA
jgi:hypothetical protein